MILFIYLFIFDVASIAQDLALNGNGFFRTCQNNKSTISKDASQVKLEIKCEEFLFFWMF